MTLLRWLLLPFITLLTLSFMIIGPTTQDFVKIGDKGVHTVKQGSTEIWTADDDTWSFIVVPDTQRLAPNNPTAYNSLIQHIVDEAISQNVKMVVFLGDLVNNGASASEWTAAFNAIDRLHAAGIPFILMAGNHDYDDDGQGSYSRKETNWIAKFPHSDFTAYDWYLGSYNNITTNMAAQITVGNYRYRFIGNEFSPRAGALTWAKGLAAESDYDRLIYAAHTLTDPEAFYAGESRPPGGTGQDGQPQYYGVCNFSTDADCKTGQEIYDELIAVEDRTAFAFSGHDVVGGGAANDIQGVRRQSAYSKRVDTVNGKPRNVHLLNYQNISTASYAGSAYYRKYTITHSDKSFVTETYNPVQDTFLTDSENQFTGNFH